MLDFSCESSATVQSIMRRIDSLRRSYYCFEIGITDYAYQCVLAVKSAEEDLCNEFGSDLIEIIIYLLDYARIE